MKLNLFIGVDKYTLEMQLFENDKPVPQDSHVSAIAQVVSSFAFAVPFGSVITVELSDSSDIQLYPAPSQN